MAERSVVEFIESSVPHDSSFSWVLDPFGQPAAVFHDGEVVPNLEMKVQIDFSFSLESSAWPAEASAQLTINRKPTMHIQTIQIEAGGE